MKRLADISPIDSTEMASLAAEEYARLLEILTALDASEWASPTVCDDWDVRQMIVHLLGAAESNASPVESFRQLVKGTRLAKKMGRPQIDGINAVQVAERDHLEPHELVDRLEATAPKAIRGRQKVPGLLRRVSMANPAGGTMTMGHLLDRVYTRDQWMHRIDICQALGRPIELTRDHDGRIIEDVVLEWAEYRTEPVTLELTGPVGNLYTSDDGGELITVDALEFCLITAGRKPSDLDLGLIVF